MTQPAQSERSADRYYIDCEFDGHGGPLLSMAIVPESPLGMSVHYKGACHVSQLRPIGNR